MDTTHTTEERTMVSTIPKQGELLSWMQDALENMREQMYIEEKSTASIDKYLRDARKFLQYMIEQEEEDITKILTISYKKKLKEQYALTSTNSMIASMNYFLRCIHKEDCVVKSYKLQQESFRDSSLFLTKDEYFRLLETARLKGKTRLYYLMQTIGTTGIRISELKYITVETLKSRRVKISMKGKHRVIILPEELCHQLEGYVKEKNIKAGSIFVSRSGQPVDRSNVCHEMKNVARYAGIDEKKAFPHNLRHLFAVIYYQQEKNVCHLADLLGHSNVNTTRIYTMISSEEQEQKINQLGLVLNS